MFLNNSSVKAVFFHDREKRYADEKKGSFLLYFKYNSRRLCIDATEENETKGRFTNHSKKGANLKMRVVVVDGEPRIVFIALKRIVNGAELYYNYSERRKEIVRENPWLK